MVPETVERNRHIVVVDGLCNFCSGLVGFIVKRDPRDLFTFAWAQGPAGIRILQWCGLETDAIGTMVYVEDGKPYFKSTGVLRVARHLRFPWSLLYLAVMIPRGLRDRMYDIFSRNRKKMFGAKQECSPPPESMREKFLQGGS